MAAPVVSGAAALLLQQNSLLTPDQIKARLMKTAGKTFPAFSSVTDATTGALLASTATKFDLNGVIGGGQIGYNWQRSNWVFGLEADIQGSGEKGSTNAVCPANSNDFPHGI